MILDCDAGRIYGFDLCCFKLGYEIDRELGMRVEGYWNFNLLVTAS